MYKPYPESFWTAVDELVKNLEPEPKAVAAFDADGTLWDIDVGEIVFDHQIKHWDLKLPENPWKYYLDLKKKEPRQAYLWLAQILEGKCIDEVLKKNEESYVFWEKENGPLPIFEEQKKLIKKLSDYGVEVYIVTASVRWSVFAGAKRLGIPTKNVIGVQTHLKDNYVSSSQKGAITYRKGKAEALFSVIGDRPLVLTAGNTMGDFELLEASQGIRLAVSAAKESDELYKTESELSEQAQAKQWFSHRFI